MNVFIMWYDRARLESLRMRKYFCVFRYEKVGLPHCSERNIVPLSSTFHLRTIVISSIHDKIEIDGKILFIENVIVLLQLIYAYLTVVLEFISSLHHRMTLMMNI